MNLIQIFIYVFLLSKMNTKENRNSNDFRESSSIWSARNPHLCKQSTVVREFKKLPVLKFCLQVHAITSHIFLFALAEKVGEKPSGCWQVVRKNNRMSESGWLSSMLLSMESKWLLESFARRRRWAGHHFYADKSKKY